MTSKRQSADGAPGKKDSPAGDANVDGASSEESGYRRDDYWREEAREDTTPGTEADPDDGFAFESTEEKVKSSGDDASTDDSDAGSEAAREQGNAGGRDDANIIEKG